MLTWENTVEIVSILKARHPGTRVQDLSLNTIYQWTIEIPGFEDDRELVNDEILYSILREWFEEVNPV